MRRAGDRSCAARCPSIRTSGGRRASVACGAAYPGYAGDMTAAATPAGAIARETTPLRPAITRPMLTVFIIGDVLGAGIYALVGEVAGKVGGAIWTSFLAAGILAAFTATAYAELVTKYPRAAGAALYAHKAYKRPFLTFLIAFAVMCSGVASAAAARGRA